MSEQGTMKLAFGTMIRAAERWRRASINDLERHHLKLLRIELRLDPPPAHGDRCDAPRRTTKRSAA
jgi:hypothetical protein